MEYVLPLEEIRKDALGLVGGKGANLGEMLFIGINVPSGFVITTHGYDRFMEGNGLIAKIGDILKNLDVENTESLNSASKKIRDLIEEGSIPGDLKKEIIAAYSKMKEKNGQLFVAVRSSATAEDLPNASFAGQQETYLNVRDEDELLESARKCWSSLFTPRAIFYRKKNNFDLLQVKLAIVVQKMVNAEISGIMFTSDPTTGEPKAIIEAGYGLGEFIVGGQVTPDTLVVDGINSKIVSKAISTQKFKLIRGENGGNVRVDVEKSLQNKQKLADKDILKLVSIGKILESHYCGAMDVEWCVENGTIYVVQARPVTTIKNDNKKSERSDSKKKAEPAAGESTMGKILVKGLGASPGSGSGTVRIIEDLCEIDKVQKGDIMVTAMTTPDMVPGMTKAVGIVTDEGGMTCHAAIVSRELGIPCIVGTGKATKVLKDGDAVTVDGKLGVVYEGLSAGADDKKAAPQDVSVQSAVPVTATNVLMNVGVPDKAEEYSRLPSRGVGLMRVEFIFTSHIQEHPVDLIKKGRSEELVTKLAEGIAKVSKAFYPRPVIVRTSDFKTNEYRGMPNGELYEPVEANPMIGWRGCSRYISANYKEAFRMELRAISNVRNEMGLKNTMVMLPFVRTVDELKEIIALMEEEGLKRTLDFRLYLMTEVPSIVFMADEFSKYCDGFSIGSNDLTQLVMGADRDSEILGKMGYFDERNLAVKRAISQLIKIAHENGRTVGICGQAPSVYPEFTEFLVGEGIDSISLNPDTVIETTKIIASAEQRIILKRLKKLADA